MIRSQQILSEVQNGKTESRQWTSDTDGKTPEAEIAAFHRHITRGNFFRAQFGPISCALMDTIPCNRQICNIVIYYVHCVAIASFGGLDDDRVPRRCNTLRKGSTFVDA
jgi:hypothetical protein